MKRIIALILTFATLLSLTACGGSAPAEPTAPETAPAVTEAPTEAPITEPTLSPEELFLQSLPEKLRQAYEIGIVELTLLEDLERLCTIEEAADTLQNICRIKFDTDSWMLTNTVTEENAAEPATRGWFMTMMYAADAEALVGVDETKSYSTNLKELTKTHNSSAIADTLLGWYENRGYVLAENKKGEVEQWGTFFGKYPGATELVKDLKEFRGDIATVSYVLTRFDRKTGEKLMQWDEDRNLRFTDSMTVQEVVETALRYHNALEPKPDFVPYDEITHYDESIITPALLEKETTLPEASCTYLPADWHGVGLSDTGQPDQLTQAHELDVIRDAGFNFVRLSFNAKYYHGRVLKRTYGKEAHPDGLNENRLKELDQLLAWCMERDIHLNLSCMYGHDWPEYAKENKFVQDPENAQGLVQFWKAIARRYADIPNHYLSFTPLEYSWGYNDEDNAGFLAPIVEAVREVSPERCIMAVVGDGKITGKGAAQLGMALSSDCYWASDFLFRYSDQKHLDKILKNATWPYEEKGVLVDGNSAMEKSKDFWGKSSPIDAVSAVAQEYGVGYMVREWGPRVLGWNAVLSGTRYSDETMQAYLTDMTQTMEERGYGWCYTDWMGTVGIAYCYPLVEDSTYTQVGDYLWIDEEMSGWFRSINDMQ